MPSNFPFVFEQVESKLSSAKQSQEKLQSMVVDAATRADAASTQVSSQSDWRQKRATGAKRGKTRNR